MSDYTQEDRVNDILETWRPADPVMTEPRTLIFYRRKERYLRLKRKTAAYEALCITRKLYPWRAAPAQNKVVPINAGKERPN